MHRIKQFTNAFVWIVSALYPIVLFVAQDVIKTQTVAVVMACVWGIRALSAEHKAQRIIALCCSLFFIVAIFLLSADVLYWYPTMLSGLMLMIFAGSLFAQQTIIERLARIQKPNLSAHGVLYTRKVTQVWCGFFIFNILLTSYLIYQENWQLWMLYTGIISYVLMGLLFAGEWLYRRFIVSKHERN